MADDRNDKNKDALDALDSRLKQARGHVQNPFDKPGSETSEKGGVLGLAFRVAVEIVSAVAIGVGVGWLLDDWLGTRPWLMLVFIVLGFAAGVLNVYRLASGFGYAAGYAKRDDNAGAGAGTDEGT